MDKVKETTILLKLNVLKKQPNNSNAMTKPRFVKRKKSNNKRAIVLLIILVLVIVLCKYLDRIMEMLFN